MKLLGNLGAATGLNDLGKWRRSASSWVFYTSVALYVLMIALWMATITLGIVLNFTL